MKFSFKHYKLKDCLLLKQIGAVEIEKSKKKIIAGIINNLYLKRIFCVNRSLFECFLIEKL